MAEAFLRKYIKKYSIYSAGIEAHGLNRYMLKVMSELGYEMKNHKSEKTEKYVDVHFDIVITLVYVLH